MDAERRRERERGGTVTLQLAIWIVIATIGVLAVASLKKKSPDASPGQTSDALMPTLGLECVSCQLSVRFVWVLTRIHKFRYRV